MLADALVQDLRYGVRMLFRNAAYTAVSVLALALGIGVNTAAFTAYKALVRRPLDAHDPGQMVNLALTLQSDANASQFSYPDYEAYRDQLHCFSGLIASSHDLLKLSRGWRRSERTL